MKSLLFSLLLVLIALPLHGQVLMDAEGGVAARIPGGWLLYRKGEAKLPNRFVYSYELPEIFSKTENTTIQNSVAVMILDQPCGSLSDVIALEKAWNSKSLQSAQDIKSDVSDAAKKQFVTIQGFNFVTRTDFFQRRKTGYVIVFTATPGTYDTNLPQYLEFLKGMKILGRPKD